MSDVQIKDLTPVPFFARFLEGQHTELTPEQMRGLRGGASVVTMAAPSDSDNAEVKPSPLCWPEVPPLPWHFAEPFPMPEFPSIPDSGPGMWPCGPAAGPL